MKKKRLFLNLDIDYYYYYKLGTYHSFLINKREKKYKLKNKANKEDDIYLTLKSLALLSNLYYLFIYFLNFKKHKCV